MNNKTKISNVEMQDFLAKQNVVNLDMKLGDLIEKVLTNNNLELDGGAIVWSSYVFVGGNNEAIRPEDTLQMVQSMTESGIIDLNSKINDLTSLVHETNLSTHDGGAIVWSSYVFVGG